MHLPLSRLVILLAFSTQLVSAQIDLVPIWRTPPPDVTFKKQLANARTSAALTPMLLPFWDDFSLNKFDGPRNTAYPNDTLWENSQRVWVNDHMGINPPSIYVATFDGYDSLGKPYAKNDILAKGFADRLTSRPLRMDLVAQANSPNVFMKFFYQYQGNGEPPDQGDVLYLYFKDKNNVWNEVWKIENDGTLDKTKFVEVNIRNLDPEKYFHNKFQFRFQNFGRISGPYDTWNVDYVYVSNGKNQYAPVYPDFPDRTIASGLTTLFKEYQAIPIKHFRPIASSLTQSPSLTLKSLRNDTTKQPINFTVKAQILERKNKLITITNSVLSNNVGTGFPLPYGIPRSLVLPSHPNLSNIDPLVDSMIVRINLSLGESDNKIKKASGGDWDTTVYKRIDFRYNDTTRATYILDNYYAYDDGSAEYGARINGIGTQLAYEFNLKTPDPDILVAFDYYFPPFGDESTQSVQFHVLGALTGQETDYLYRRNTQIKRSTNNVFVRENLASPVIVQGKFYIGWRLLSNALIPVGLDRSFDSGSKMFYNSSGDWIQNQDLKGSLMIRPVFIRKGQPLPPTAVEGDLFVLPFPNPSNGVFFLPSQAQQVLIYTTTGQLVECSVEDELDKKKITIPSSPGVYLVRYFADKWFTKKIVVAR